MYIRIDDHPDLYQARNFSRTGAFSGQATEEQWQGSRGMMRQLALDNYLA